MTGRTIAEIAGAALLVLGTLSATRSWSDRRVAALNAERIAALVRADSAEARQARTDTIAALRIAREEARADSAIREARAAHARRPTVITEIVERSSPDSVVRGIVRAAVEEAVDSIDAREIAPRDVIIASLRSELAAKDEQIAARDARIVEQAGAIDAANAQIRALTRTSRLGRIERVALKVAVPAGGVVGWWLRGQLDP